MWNVKLPSVKTVMDDIDKAFTYVDGRPKHVISISEKASVEKLYKSYHSNKGIASVKLEGKLLGKALLDAFENAYSETQQNGRLFSLRNALLLNARTCPCCGISIPDELDHHLPKSDYQVLSIYPRNLIPYCHKCNNKKRAISGIDPNERFIHAYYDLIPTNQQFLFIKAILKGKSLTFQLSIKLISGLSQQLVDQMNFQHRRVGLHNRLKKELNLYFSSVATYIQSDYETRGITGVKENLKKAAKHQAKEFGLNHWRHAVFQALSENDDFCDGGFYEALALKRPSKIKTSLTSAV